MEKRSLSWKIVELLADEDGHIPVEGLSEYVALDYKPLSDDLKDRMMAVKDPASHPRAEQTTLRKVLLEFGVVHSNVDHLYLSRIKYYDSYKKDADRDDQDLVTDDPMVIVASGDDAYIWRGHHRVALELLQTTGRFGDVFLFQF